jgi:hypothetical protein
VVGPSAVTIGVGSGFTVMGNPEDVPVQPFPLVTVSEYVPDEFTVML